MFLIPVQNYCCLVTPKLSTDYIFNTILKWFFVKSVF
jgi:hypothetical protein